MASQEDSLCQNERRVSWVCTIQHLLIWPRHFYFEWLTQHFWSRFQVVNFDSLGAYLKCLFPTKIDENSVLKKFKISSACLVPSRNTSPNICQIYFNLVTPTGVYPKLCKILNVILLVIVLMKYFEINCWFWFM